MIGAISLVNVACALDCEARDRKARMGSRFLIMYVRFTIYDLRLTIDLFNTTLIGVGFSLRKWNHNFFFRLWLSRRRNGGFGASTSYTSTTSRSSIGYSSVTSWSLLIITIVQLSMC